MADPASAAAAERAEELVQLGERHQEDFIKSLGQMFRLIIGISRRGPHPAVPIPEVAAAQLQGAAAHCRAELAELRAILTELDDISLDEICIDEVTGATSDEGCTDSPQVIQLKARKDELIQYVRERNRALKGMIDRLRSLQLTIAALTSTDPQFQVKT